ncbi:MAG TPA: NTP transferase domain-containing protein [Acidimicrobiales bacterium]
MSHRRSLVVLAAGVGSRFGGMKQLAQVGPGGRALMDYAVYDALRSGFGRVVFVVSERTRAAVEDHARAGCGRRAEVTFALQSHGERDKPWGTGHAVLSARPFVDGDFAVVNADDYYGRRSFGLLGEELAVAGDDHLLVGYTLRETLSAHGGVSRGLCLLDGDRLKAVVELHQVRHVDGGFTSREPEWRHLSGDEIVSTNLWGFREPFFDVLEEEFDAFLDERGADHDAEFYIGTAVNALIEGGKAAVKVVRTPDRFFGMTFPEDRPAVERQLAERVAGGEYPADLWD